MKPATPLPGYGLRPNPSYYLDMVGSQKISPTLATVRGWFGPSEAGPWFASARFRRYAWPDLGLAALCLLMVLTPLSRTDYAKGLADAVAVQVFFCFLDIPVLYVVAVLARLRAPRALLAIGLIAVYLAEGWWIYSFTWGAGYLNPGVFTLFLLPLALRAWSLVQGLGDVERVNTWVIFSICLIIPWMLSLTLVLIPMTEWFGFERAIPGSEATEPLPPAWLATGVLYFTLVGFARYVLVRLMARRRS